MTERAHSTAVVLAFACIYLVWGTTYLAIAFAIRDVPPFLLGGLRYIVAGLLVYAWLRWSDPRPWSGINSGGAIVCGLLFTGMGNGLLVWSQKAVPSGIAALFVAAMPVWIILLDWVFFSRRTPRLSTTLGVLLGLAGVVVLVSQRNSFSGNIHPIHLVAVGISQLGWSIGTLLQRRYIEPGRIPNFTSVQLTVGGGAQLLAATFNGDWGRMHWAALTTPAVLAWLYLVLAGSILATSCYAWLIAHVSAHKVSTYALVNPVIAMALGALILHERVGPPAILAGTLVLAGVSLILFNDLWARRRRFA